MEYYQKYIFAEDQYSVICELLKINNQQLLSKLISADSAMTGQSTHVKTKYKIALEGYKTETGSNLGYLKHRLNKNNKIVKVKLPRIINLIR